MTSSIVGGGQESVNKFLETLQADLKILAGETKKKYPQIKEVYIFLPFVPYLYVSKIILKIQKIG